MKCQRNLESGIKKALQRPWGRKRDMQTAQSTKREYSSTIILDISVKITVKKETQREDPRATERRIRARTRNYLHLG